MDTARRVVGKCAALVSPQVLTRCSDLFRGGLEASAARDAPAWVIRAVSLPGGDWESECVRSGWCDFGPKRRTRGFPSRTRLQFSSCRWRERRAPFDEGRQNQEGIGGKRGNCLGQSDQAVCVSIYFRETLRCDATRCKAAVLVGTPAHEERKKKNVTIRKLLRGLRFLQEEDLELN
jgi:hypothetical protein